MRVYVCAEHFNPADSYELIEIVQAWRRGPAQTQGIIPPHSCTEHVSHHPDHHASSCDQEWKYWKVPHDATSSKLLDEIEP